MSTIPERQSAGQRTARVVASYVLLIAGGCMLGIAVGMEFVDQLNGLFNTMPKLAGGALLGLAPLAMIWLGVYIANEK